MSSPEDGLDKLAKHARGVLVLIAVLQLGAGFLLWAAGSSVTHDRALEASIVGVFYVGLAVWARRQPMPAVLTGLAVYGSSLVYTAIQTGVIIGGLYDILLKGVLAIMFINGIATARAYEATKQRLTQSGQLGPRANE